MNNAKKMMVVIFSMFFVINFSGFLSGYSDSFPSVLNSKYIDNEFKKEFLGSTGLSPARIGDIGSSEMEIYSNVNLYGFEDFFKSIQEFSADENPDAHEAFAGGRGPASGLGVFPFIAIAILINMLIQAIGWLVMNNLTQAQWDAQRIPRE